ncbi:MFS transporter [Geodermatophilus sp. SYSU D00779]
MRGLVEAVLPARMGTPFRWLVGSSWVGNLGDGIALAAGPLLVAGQTQDPLLVALGALAQRLPWLLLGLQAGVLADRVDRRRLLIGVALARGGILLGQLVGGLLARAWGVTGPFWFGFVGSAVILALIWRQLAHVAHAGEEASTASVS